MRPASWYRAMNYRPGGRDWMFRRPATLEVVLTLTPTSRIRQWIYGHWPVVPREVGTKW
jgi:hypothetical protein